MKILYAGLVCLLGLSAGCVSTRPSVPEISMGSKLESKLKELSADTTLPKEMKGLSSEETDAITSNDAGRLIEFAFSRFQEEEYGLSADLFSKALVTGMLNDAGRSLAYWHMGVSYYNVGNEDLNCEAMSSFITTSLDLIEENPGLDFVSNFNLENKIMHASSMVNFAWVNRAEYFGKSENIPIPVYGTKEIVYFTSLMYGKGCKEQDLFSLRQSDLDDKLYKADIKCNDTSDTFYFYLMK